MERVENQIASAKELIKKYGVAVLTAVLIALSIRLFIVEAYRIPSSSMKPTLEPGDTIFVSKWPFGLRLPGADEPLTHGRMPRRGEVVVYALPSDPSRDYIKRVVGLPGDTVQMKAGNLIVNGQALSFNPKENEVCGLERIDSHPYGICREPPIFPDYGPSKVPQDSVFVMGDLRTLTPEQQFHPTWGNVPTSLLKGKALLVWLSIEPPGTRGSSGWFSRIRFERMGKEIQ